MSQPAVSKALRRLRETFDDPLFVRGPSGIVPTPRAHELVRTARPHIGPLCADLLKGEGFDPSTSTRPIVLGLSDIAEMAFLPSILDHFRVHAPKAAVRSEEHTSELHHSQISYAVFCLKKKTFITSQIPSSSTS